jgi:hypothetical protein
MESKEIKFNFIKLVYARDKAHKKYIKHLVEGNILESKQYKELESRLNEIIIYEVDHN